MSSKERHAIGIAIDRPDGRTLYGRRIPGRSREYMGFWSLPSLSIDPEEFQTAVTSHRLSDQLLSKVSQRRLGGIKLTGGQFLISGSRHRTNYLLKMAIFSASCMSVPTGPTEKYESFRFMTPSEYVLTNGTRCGTCCSLYFQNLINRQLLESTFYCLELSPELADSPRPLDDYTPEELWQFAAPNYSLLVRGESGGDGHVVLSLTLDRFLDQYINSSVHKDTRVLDVGCGEGRLLEKIADRTKWAHGLELVEELDVRPSVRANVVNEHLLNSVKIFGKDSFDLIIMNLMLFWLPNLEDVARIVQALLRKGGRLLLTATTPEFTKNCRWERDNTGSWVMVVTQPLRRQRTLAMINRSVGPLWFYPRSTVDVLETFGRNEVLCVGGGHIFVDSYLSSSEQQEVYAEYPSLKRHEMLPAFTALFFTRNG